MRFFLLQSSRLMSKINSHIKSDHPELSVPEFVQQRESFEESDDDDYGPYEMSPKSSDKKSLDFSAIAKFLSVVIPSRGNNNFQSILLAHVLLFLFFHCRKNS